MLFYFLFLLGVILYGLGEGLTEDATWNWKSGKIGYFITDTSSYHTVRRCVESFGIWIMIFSALNMSYSIETLWHLLCLFPFWFLIYTSTKIIERKVPFKDLNKWDFDIKLFGKVFNIPKPNSYLMLCMGIVSFIVYIGLIFIGGV